MTRAAKGAETHLLVAEALLKLLYVSPHLAAHLLSLQADIKSDKQSSSSLMVLFQKPK